MTERGVFAVARSIFEDEDFAPEKFTEREAWMWLISEAAWKPRKRRVGSVVVQLNRAQIAVSLRHLARVWRWSPAKSHRFVNRLKSEAKIETETKQGITVITICKYDKYQRTGLPRETETSTENETGARQQRDNTETLETIWNKKEGGADAPGADLLESENVIPIRRYAFEGRVIRLAQADFDRWRSAYRMIPDLSAALQTADDYYAENPPKDGKWFFPVSRWLQRENEQADKRRIEEQRRRGDRW